MILEEPIAKSNMDANNDIVMSDIKFSNEYSGSAAAMKKGSIDLVKEVNKTLDRLNDNNNIDKITNVSYGNL